MQTYAMILAGQEKNIDNLGEMTQIVNHDRVGNQAVNQQFHGPVYLSVYLMILFQ